MLKKRLPAWLVEEPAVPYGKTAPAAACGAEPDSISLEEELRQAYLAAVGKVSPAEEKHSSLDDLMPPAGTRPSFMQDYLDPAGTTTGFGNIQAKTSAVMKLLQRPRIAAAVAVGLCVLASTAYAGLGFCWWVMSDSARAQAGEPVALLGEAGDLHGDTKQVLKNIERLQQQSEEMKNLPVERDDEAASHLLAAANPADEKFALLDVETSGPASTEPVGRADPFAPLVQANGPISGAGMLAVKRDVLELIQYTGFIGDMNARDKVAILKINDPALGDRTLVKKIGEAFLIDGERVILKGIAKGNVRLMAGGSIRTLSLNPYQEVSLTSSGTGTTGSNPAGGQAGGATTSATGGAAAAGKPENPQLQEPK